MRRPLSRRDFVLRGVRAACAVPLALPVARCAGGAARDAELAEQARRLGEGLDCTDTRGLLPAEILTRTSNDYTETSATAGQFCFVCDNYREPRQPGTCGTCTTVRGPINPGGWCKAWVARR